MYSKRAGKKGGPPPPALPALRPAKPSEPETAGSTGEIREEEPLDTTLAELLMAAECDMGCDFPEGPLSPNGCRW